MPILDVFVDGHCWGCDEARALVAKIRQHFPTLCVQLRERQMGKWPQEVFAVPTYMLNGRVISLGNPSFARLQHQVSAAMGCDQDGRVPQG